jgi:oxalate decarboxylase
MTTLDDPRPRTLSPELQRHNLFNASDTGSGAIPNLRFVYSDAHDRAIEGGWAREMTQRELPIATSLAGVNMRLRPGGVRALHWHEEAEWGYMVAGSARLTAVDESGHNSVGDVGVGDVWLFPAGIAHSIQGMDDGCEFLLIFDNGNFSENETLPVTDWPAQVPGPIPGKNRFIHRLADQEPIDTPAGFARIVDSSTFPICTTIAAAVVELSPGAMRELHWHPNTDEWHYYIEGNASMGVFDSAGNGRTFDFEAGDVGCVPSALGHYVENTGKEPLRLIEAFKSDRFADIALDVAA